MAQTNLGRIAMIFRGEYQPDKPYVALDVVYSAGSTYLCIEPCTGVQPPNAAKWHLMAPSPSLVDRQAAEAAAQAAQVSKTAAETAKTAAENSKTAAAGSATAAQTAKTAAESAKTAAAGSATAAEAAKNAAVSAKAAAEQAAASVPTIDQTYPVGIIISLAIGTSPATLWPGTVWSAVAPGRVLVGQDTADADFDTLGETGGSKLHAHGLAAGHAKAYHAGTASFNWKTKTGLPGYSVNVGFLANVVNVTENNASNAMELGGSTDNGSTLQPYEVVKYWKRTA